MAHEELKALYEIDSQHSDTPWEFWEIFDTSQKDWVCEFKFEPSWLKCCRYRRKPDAPVWPDDKEDARKWRELVKIYDQVSEDGGLPERFYSEIVFGVKGLMNSQPKLIQGYTAEQWQTIIDGEFLCEFSDVDFSLTSGPFIIGRLDEIKPWKEKRSFTGLGVGFVHCRPLRIKGVRQPWFGGECPVEGKVVAKCEDGEVILGQPAKHMWKNDGTFKKVIVEFIEL